MTMERIAIAEPVFNGNEKKYLMECIDTGWVSANGRFVNEFQKKFAEYCGSKYAIACANGTVTLMLIMKALNIGPGDEVIVPSNTFIATVLAISQVGASPILVDPDMDTYNISYENIKNSITNKTKAIIVVHLYGQSADMDEILEIVKGKNIKIKEIIHGN